MLRTLAVVHVEQVEDIDCTEATLCLCCVVVPSNSCSRFASVSKSEGLHWLWQIGGVESASGAPWGTLVLRVVLSVKVSRTHLNLVLSARNKTLARCKLKRVRIDDNFAERGQGFSLIDHDFKLFDFRATIVVGIGPGESD